MKDIIINISKEKRMVNVSKSFIGNDGENLQGNLIFKFEDEFVDGIARLEYEVKGEKKYAILTKNDEEYNIPIKSVLTFEGQINMQLVITEEERDEGIPIFKSNVFYVYCNKSVNAEIEEPEEYADWIEVANQKLIEVDKAITEVKEFETKVDELDEKVIEIESNIESVENNIVEIENDIDDIVGDINEIAIDVDNNSKNITNLANTKADKTDIPDLTDYVKDSNYVHTDNNYTTTEKTKLSKLSNYDDKQIKQEISKLSEEKANKTEIPDVSEFIKKNVNNLVNYYKKNETYTQSEVNELIGAIKTISMKIVPERPQKGESNIIYLVPSSKTTKENIYEEYIYVSNKWELIGSTQIDLSNYYTKEEINTLLFDYITSNDLEEILENYAKIEDIPDVSEFITDEEVDGKLEDYVELDKFNTLSEKVADIELFKFPNAIIHGEPTINNGQVSNFSSSNYLSLPAIFDLHDRGFEFNFAFRTGSDVTTAQNILGSKFCMALFIQNSKINLRVSSNGSSWNLVDIQGNIDIRPNTIYYIQIYYDKLTYKLRYSLDGIEYTDIGSKVASTPPYASQIYLGIGNNFFNPYQGIINLNKCSLKINNSMIWQGMDDAGLQTRLATDMENIDEAGIEKVKEITKEYIDEEGIAPYKAGESIEITDDNVINNTFDKPLYVDNLVNINLSNEDTQETFKYLINYWLNNNYCTSDKQINVKTNVPSVENIKFHNVHIKTGYVSQNLFNINLYFDISPIQVNSNGNYNYGVSYQPIIKTYYYQVFIDLDEYDNKNVTNVYSDNYKGKTTVTRRYNNTEAYLIQSGYINQLVGKDNTSSWTPKQDYGLVHKKYVDDAIKQYTKPITITGNPITQENIRGVTCQQLIDANVTSGTYLVHAHESTSSSQSLFFGFIEIFENNATINDVSFHQLFGNNDKLVYTYYNDEYYLTYTGSHDYGSRVTFTFIKIDDYVDN